ncbi:hypothetical protein E6W39_29315 [Kitasatospora acidiphila]|uniref:4Fe-4S Wbl-type domain-containing protein n=1 Tax=Kitasatospora acidiphila TaxID=2567942 RepID=A0A540WAZ5_9ACTN|nr:hypothetical protein [Kitasatospora acidiphila]TQF05584.1 hypothetical protein E6W39_29315 [Kitasatospora acidiphila]
MPYSALPTTDTLIPGCYGHPGFAPKSALYSDRSQLLKLCLPLLPTCGPCPVRARCLKQTQPRAGRLDGIAGGRIWFQGEVLATVEGADDQELPPALGSRQACGTRSGIDEHYKRGERYCDACRTVLTSSTQLQLTE